MLKRLSVPVVLLILVVATRIDAQLQTSGGSAVSISAPLPAGTNVIGHVIVDTAPTTAVTNANLDVALSTRLKPADTLAGVTTVGAVTQITNALPAGTNVIGTVKSVPLTTCGATPFDSSAGFLPTSLTVVTATATCPIKIHFNNMDTVSHVLLLTDGSTLCGGAACTYLGGTSPNFSIPPGTSDLPLDGMKFTGGIKWQVTDGATNKIVAQVIGYQ